MENLYINFTIKDLFNNARYAIDISELSEDERDMTLYNLKSCVSVKNIRTSKVENKTYKHLRVVCCFKCGKFTHEQNIKRIDNIEHCPNCDDTDNLYTPCKEDFIDYSDFL